MIFCTPRPLAAQTGLTAVPAGYSPGSVLRNSMGARVMDGQDSLRRQVPAANLKEKSVGIGPDIRVDGARAHALSIYFALLRKHQVISDPVACARIATTRRQVAVTPQGSIDVLGPVPPQNAMADHGRIPGPAPVVLDQRISGGSAFHQLARLAFILPGAGISGMRSPVPGAEQSFAEARHLGRCLRGLCSEKGNG